MSVRNCDACSQPLSGDDSRCPACMAAAQPSEDLGAAPQIADPEPAAEFPDQKLRDRNHGFSLTWILCGACVLIFLAAAGMGPVESQTAYEKIGLYSSEAIWKGAYWALITSALVHLDFIHLFMNLYWLWWFGHAFERSFGAARWLLFFGVAAWVSSGAQLLSGDTGIGASGVGYALLGFGWVARARYPEFRLVMPDRIIRGFLIWFFVCIGITMAGIMRIGNEAHLGGLLFGVLTARLILMRPVRAWVPIGLAALTSLSVLPLAWCPWSMVWTSVQAERAHQERRYAEAAGWYHRSLALGQDPTWVWYGLAGIYGYQEAEADYANALRNLRQVSPERADEIQQRYGPPRDAR